EATVTDEAESEALEVPLHSPAFLFERVSRDAENRVVEFVRSVYRGDRYQFRVDLQPVGPRRAAERTLNSTDWPRAAHCPNPPTSTCCLRTLKSPSWPLNTGWPSRRWPLPVSRSLPLSTQRSPGCAAVAGSSKWAPVRRAGSRYSTSPNAGPPSVWTNVTSSRSWPEGPAPCDRRPSTTRTTATADAPTCSSSRQWPTTS